MGDNNELSAVLPEDSPGEAAAARRQSGKYKTALSKLPKNPVGMAMGSGWAEWGTTARDAYNVARAARSDRKQEEEARPAAVSPEM